MTKAHAILALAMAILITSMTMPAFATVNGGTATKPFSIILPPLEVGNDDQQTDEVFAFDEKQGHVLVSPLHVDFLATDKTAGDIPAGTVISSTMMIYDPVNYVPSTGEGAVEGCVTFDESVLGIQFLDATLIAGDVVVGLDTVSYANVNYRGIEVPPHSNGDQVWFSTANSVCFDLVASTPGDTFRVITEGDHNTIVLWQVGVFDQSFRDMSQGGTLYTGPYNANINPINDCGGIPSVDCVNPDFPGILGTGTTQNYQWADNVTITFDSPSCSEAMLLYSRAGIETDEIFFDGESLGTVSSQEGVYKRFDFDIGALEAGSHSVTIDYLDTNNSQDDLHAIDAISLVCWEPKTPACEIDPNSINLIAGKHTDSGDVEITNDGDNLIITITTQDGWSLHESHVSVQASVGDIPHTKKGNPIPGQFEYSQSYVPNVTEAQYIIPLDELPEDLTIAVHTVVQQIVNDEVVAEETAWAEGQRFVQKGNWGMYTEYGLQCLE